MDFCFPIPYYYLDMESQPVRSWAPISIGHIALLFASPLKHNGDGVRVLSAYPSSFVAYPGPQKDLMFSHLDLVYKTV